MGSKTLNKNILSLVAGISILAVLLAFKFDLSDFVSTVSAKISYGFYAVISVAIVVQLVFRSLRFNLLYNRTQEDKISLTDSFVLTGASFLVAMATPNKLGDTTRGLFFGKKRIEITAITLIEYLFDSFILVAVAFVGIVVVYRQYLPQVVLAVAVLAAGAAVLLYLVKSGHAGKLLAKSDRFKGLAGKLDLLKAYFGAGIKSKFVLLVGFIFSCCFHATYFLIFYAVLREFGAGLSVTDVLFAAGVGMFVGSLTFIPMGIGTRDASTYGLLYSLGVESDVALSSVIIMRSLSVALLLASAVCYFTAIHRFKR
jgi:uncharacterized protein (TIRG00374 family)